MSLFSSRQSVWVSIKICGWTSMVPRVSFTIRSYYGLKLSFTCCPIQPPFASGDCCLSKVNKFWRIDFVTRDMHFGASKWLIKRARLVVTFAAPPPGELVPWDCGATPPLLDVSQIGASLNLCSKYTFDVARSFCLGDMTLPPYSSSTFPTEALLMTKYLAYPISIWWMCCISSR